EQSDVQKIENMDNLEVQFVTTHTMLECCGCENVILRQRTWCDLYDVDYFDDVFFPPPTSRQLPPWHKKLPKEIQELLGEVYTALHSDSRMLAMMGARAIVDLFMNDKLGDKGGFSEKLKKLVNEGHISKANKDILEPALEAGHAATHRGHKANRETVIQVIDIVENLIQGYVLTIAADDLKKVTPIRKRNT
ncbi:hypothetical protein LCGC14_3108450, partial [marine sediment metagenome]